MGGEPPVHSGGMLHRPPPQHVIEAFGAVGRPEQLPGGTGRTWRVGDVVLKPLDVLPGELDWLHRFDAEQGVSGRPPVRLSIPIASRTGTLVVDGWTAFPLLAGEHGTGEWAAIAAVAHSFAERLGAVARPAFLDERTHAWARADRLAWGEGEEPADIADAPYLMDLLAARTVVSDPSGIIHGDLAGNVLFDDDLGPAVIDLTLYWRPVRYAVAIIAVDAVCFEGAPTSLLSTIEPSDGFLQHLVRALVFRIATDWYNGSSRAEFDVYGTAVGRVLELVRTGRLD